MDTESTLLASARRMNEDALVEIFDLYSAAIFRYALRLCGDPMLADHIVGDVFAKLLDQLAAGNGPTSNLRGYLFEIAHHRIVDEVRYVHRRAPLEVADEFRGDAHSTVLGLEDQILYNKIWYLIRYELTVDQRHVLVLRFMEGFSLRETAAILGKQVDYIKVIQHRAIAALRRSLEHKGGKQAVSSARGKNLPRVLMAEYP